MADPQILPLHLTALLCFTSFCVQSSPVSLQGQIQDFLPLFLEI